MRFILNKFPDDESFLPEDGWTPLKEPGNLWAVQFQALPFLVVNVVLMILLMRLIGIRFDFNSTTMLVSFLLFMPFHELLHALFFPENLLSKNVYIGFTVKGMVPFAAYVGEMKRKTFLRISLAPLVVITILGFIWLIVFGSNSLVEHIVVFNALGACADCLGVYLVLRQVPKHAMVRNKGIRTYWKSATL